MDLDTNEYEIESSTRFCTYATYKTNEIYTDKWNLM